MVKRSVALLGLVILLVTGCSSTQQNKLYANHLASIEQSLAALKLSLEEVEREQPFTEVTFRPYKIQVNEFWADACNASAQVQADFGASHLYLCRELDQMDRVFLSWHQRADTHQLNFTPEDLERLQSFRLLLQDLTRLREQTLSGDGMRPLKALPALLDAWEGFVWQRHVGETSN